MIITAKPWQDVGNTWTGKTPCIEGNIPSSQIHLSKRRLEKGRHYITIAGPHFRPAGVFEGLDIRVAGKKISAPLYQFALLADTHLGKVRSEYRNVIKMRDMAAQLADTFKRLKDQGLAFAILAGI